MLPEGCIAEVLSLTTPKDACRLSLVSTTFRSAADSDVVWDKFVPDDYKSSIISQSTPTSLPPLFSKKDLYLWLCDHPLIIDHGTKSFSLEKSSGKRCYMLGARDLNIAWSDTPHYWEWTSHSDSRFEEVAELRIVCWLEIRGKINTNLLSQDSTYTAFLVYKLTEESYGFKNITAEASIGLHGGVDDTRTHMVYLDPNSRRHRILPTTALGSEIFNSANTRMEGEDGMFYPKVREDGWMEIKLGEYSINNNSNEDKNMELEMSLMEVEDGNCKRGLIVQGIEIRPKLN